MAGGFDRFSLMTVVPPERDGPLVASGVLPNSGGRTAGAEIAREGRVLTGFLRFVTFGRAKNHAVTIGGWTPGIRALARGHALSCGCLAGIYHTLSEDVAEIIDAAAGDCPLGHDKNLVLWRQSLGEHVSSVLDSGGARFREALPLSRHIEIGGQRADSHDTVAPGNASCVPARCDESPVALIQTKLFSERS